MPSCRPSEPVRLAIAFSRPGPAWNDDEAAASSSNDDVSWNSANHAPSPTAGRATSAINVEFSLGSPIRRVGQPIGPWRISRRPGFPALLCFELVLDPRRTERAPQAGAPGPVPAGQRGERSLYCTGLPGRQPG